MRCPNCSYTNPDASKECKLCGYQFVSAKPISELPHTLDKDKGEPSQNASITMDSESQNSKPLSYTSELDVDTIRHLLKREDEEATAPLTQQPEPSRESAQSKSDDMKSPEAKMEDVGASLFEPSNHLKIILLTLFVLIVLVIFLQSSLADMTWNYQSSKKSSTELTKETTTEESATNETTSNDDISTLSSKPVDHFFTQLPDYLQQGNLLILNALSNSEEGVRLLTEFSKVGTLVQLNSLNTVSSQTLDQQAFYVIESLMDYSINGSNQTIVASWYFEVLNDSAQWKIKQFAFDIPVLNLHSTNYEALLTVIKNNSAQQAVDTVDSLKEQEPKTTEENEDDSASTPPVQTTTEKTTEPEPLKGFKTSGGFSGGEAVASQDISAVRYGHHDSFERLVFDLSDWNYGNETVASSQVGPYQATINAEQTVITITLNGAADASARQKGINLKGSPNIQGVTFTQGDGDAVEIVITLNRASQYKVFTMKSPGKLVVDIAQ